MSDSSPSHFLDILRTARLLDDAILSELERVSATDAGLLARKAIDKGWLSPYQAEELLAGRGDGLLVGPYRLIEKLPALAEQVNFKASHPAVPGLMLLKLVSTTWLAPADTVEDYVARLQAACLANSPHLTNVLDAGLFGEQIYIVQEYADGCDMHQLVAEMGAMPVSLAAEYARQAAIAVKAAHDRGIVHGAVSPMTLILTPVKRIVQEATGFVSVRPRPGSLIKLTDLALTPRRPALRDIVFEQSHQLGDVAYQPPERFGQAGQDAAGDLYGLGASLFFLLTGRGPFQGDSVLNLLLELQQGEPAALATLRPDLPAEISGLVRRLLSRNPEDRPDTSEIIGTLLPFCERTAMPVASVAPVPVASETFTRPPIQADDLMPEHDAPLVEPLSDSQNIDTAPAEEDQFGAADSPRRARPRAKPRKSLKWIIAGLLLHGTAVFLLVGWATNWYAFLRPAAEKQDEPKNEKKSDPKPGKSKKKAPAQMPAES